MLPNGPQFPYVLTSGGYGISTPWGIQLPPGSQVAAFVRSTGFSVTNDDSWTITNGVTTLASAVARVRAGFGDTIVVLPNHAENVADAAMLTSQVAGMKIVGIGQGTAMPTFTWTAAASNWPITAANVSITGLKLNLGGFNGVTEAVTVTGSNCFFLGNKVLTATSASLLCTVGINVSGASADDFTFVGNQVYSVAGDPTGTLEITAANRRALITDNLFNCSASNTLGQIYISAAALDLNILRNYMCNTKSASTCNIFCEGVAATGMIADCRLSSLVGTGTAPASTGIILTANSLIRCHQNYSTPTAATSGLLTPAADS